MVGAMVGLAGARQLMALARVAHQLDDLLLAAQDGEELLSLADRHTVVLLAVEQKQRRIDLMGVSEGRVVPELLVELPGVAAKLDLDQLVGIAGAVLSEQVIDAAGG